MPPDFCHASKERDSNDVMPVFPRFLPFFAFSAAFIAAHFSLEIPEGTYSKRVVDVVAVVEREAAGVDGRKACVERDARRRGRRNFNIVL